VDHTWFGRVTATPRSTPAQRRLNEILSQVEKT
jgi:hypothetical protein